MKHTSLATTATVIAALALSVAGAGAQVGMTGNTVTNAANFGYFGTTLYPFGPDNSLYSFSSQFGGVVGYPSVTYGLFAANGQPFSEPLDYAYGATPLGDGTIYIQGFNGNFGEAPPGGATSGPDVYGYNFFPPSSAAAPSNNTNSTAANGQGAATDQNGETQDGSQQGNAVPNAAPTGQGNPGPTRRQTQNAIHVIHRRNGRTEIQYRGSTANTVGIRFALLDRSRHIVTESTITGPPASTSLIQYSNVRYYWVKVQYNDGTARTFFGQVK